MQATANGMKLAANLAHNTVLSLVVIMMMAAVGKVNFCIKREIALLLVMACST